MPEQTGAERIVTPPCAPHALAEIERAGRDLLDPAMLPDGAIWLALPWGALAGLAEAEAMALVRRATAGLPAAGIVASLSAAPDPEQVVALARAAGVTHLASAWAGDEGREVRGLRLVPLPLETGGAPDFGPAGLLRGIHRALAEAARDPAPVPVAVALAAEAGAARRHVIATAAALTAGSLVPAALAGTRAEARALRAAEDLLPAGDALHDLLARARTAAAGRRRRHAPAPLRVFPFGPRFARTPLAYAPLADLPEMGVELTRDPSEAQVVVTGFDLDLREGAVRAAMLADRFPHLRFAVLSEEPLWDTTWATGFADPVQAVPTDRGPLAVSVLNHVTTDLFAGLHLPYFLLTDDRFAVRYRPLLLRVARLGGAGLREAWGRAPHPAAFMAERREDDAFRGGVAERDLWRLGWFRSRTAALCAPAGALVHGQGWTAGPPRQALPDWHMDKLARLQGAARVISAVENTHAPHYVTEKPFDALACGAIPAVFAAPGHATWDWVSPEAAINLYGLAPEAAAEAILAEGDARAEAVAHNAWLLAQRMADTRAIRAARAQVAARVTAALVQVAQAGPAARAA